MVNCDFLVIGAGIAGASAGYELAAHGSVIVLEREPAPGYHSTGRSAAQFLESYGNATVRALTHASREFFQQPPDGFAEHPLLSLRGALFVASEGDVALLTRTLAEIQALVGSARQLSVSEAIERVPVLRGEHLAGAFYEPDSMDMDVAAIHQGFLRGLRRRGGQVVTQAETHEIQHIEGAWQVRTACDTYTSPCIVNAAGAWCDQVAQQAGVEPVGLTPKRRTAFTFDPPAGVEIGQWPLVMDVAEAFYFKPESGQILASPADETPVEPGDAQPEDLDVAITVDRLERATTLDIRRLNRRWAGLRTFCPDKTPVAGLDDAAPGFFWLAGQGGYGITTAPSLARAAAAVLTDSDFPPDLLALGVTAEGLSPARLRP